MCGKATPEPGGVSGAAGVQGGFGELLFLDTNRKLVRVGGRRLMRKHKCNTMLMSVFLCDRLLPQLTAAPVRRRQTDMNCREGLWPCPGGFTVRKVTPFTRGHTRRLELSPRYK